MACEVGDCVWKARLRDLIAHIRETAAQLTPLQRDEYRKLLDQLDDTELELDMEDMTV